METLLPGFYTGAEAHGGEALSMCARYLSEAPAKFFGLWPRKGALAVGADADVAVLSLGEWHYDAGAARDELNWSPFDGARFTARVTSTYLRGMVALDALESRSVAGMGRFCPRVVQESLLF